MMTKAEARHVVSEIRRAGEAENVFDVARDGLDDPDGDYTPAERKMIQEAAREAVLKFSEDDIEDAGRRRVLAAQREWGAKENPRPAKPRLRWVPWSLDLKKKLDGRSGAYAIRSKKTKEVVYVGESNHGVLYRTIARHFYTPPSKGSSFATSSPGSYEVAWQITTVGRRPRNGSKAPDQRALNKQARWIEALQPTNNKDDGLALDDSFDFGANVAPAVPNDAWGGLLNPGRKLTLLGKLTRLETVKHTYSWSLRDAPLLAYDENGKLFICYRGRVIGPSSDAQQKEYKRTHWGLDGDGNRLAADIAPGPFTLGEISTRIAYTTEKGTDRKLTDYVHEWGDYGGRKKPFTPPRVARHTCSGHGRCGSRDALALVGGSYVVKTDGIVG